MKMSDEMVLAPRVATEEMKLAGYSALIHVFEDEMCEPNPEDWGRAYASMVQAFEAVAWEAARNQVIREMIEKADAESAHVTMNTQEGRNALAASLWLRDQLKSQMEGE
jgi:hypothetical protein